MHHFFLTRKGRRVDDQVKAVAEQVVDGAAGLEVASGRDPDRSTAFHDL
jgi:hypothetical protein